MRASTLVILLAVCIAVLLGVPGEAKKLKKALKKGVPLALLAGGSGYALGSYHRQHHHQQKHVYHITQHHHHHMDFKGGYGSYGGW